MRLVVQHDDVLQPHQVAAGAAQHLAFGFDGLQFRTMALQQRPPCLRHLHVFAPAEGVVVGDDDLRPLDVAEHIVRHEFAIAVIAVRIVRQEHLQPVLDRDAGRDDQKGA